VELTAEQRDRACGVLLATGAGDALGAGYEFGPPLAEDAPVTMRGGGACNWAPGEWTDDTAMVIAIAEVAATGADLRGVDAQDQIVARWVGWSRTAPVALAYLDDPAGLAEAAMAVSALTRFDQSAGEACVLWSLAIRHAVLTGELDARAGLGYLPARTVDVWAARLVEAEKSRPRDFSSNGWVVEALQATGPAASAIAGRG
jgi:ADP-ribosylglycohydrolase